MASFSGKLKNILTSIIDRMATDPAPYVHNPSDNFAGIRKIAFGVLIRPLLSMDGISLNKELYSYFKPTDIETSSAPPLFSGGQKRGFIIQETFDRLAMYNFCQRKNVRFGLT